MVTNRVTVLVVEDEPLIRALVAEVLEDAGFAVTEAADGEEAMAVLDGLTDPPTVLATDINLGPGTDGIALATEARDRWPGLPVVYITGSPDRLANRRLADDERLVVKPFDPLSLPGLIAGMV